MTMTTLDQRTSVRTSNLPVRAFTAIITRVAELRAEALRRRRHKQTLMYLHDLADWQLDDIGFDRHEVQAAMHRAGIHVPPDRLFDGRR